MRIRIECMMSIQVDSGQTDWTTDTMGRPCMKIGYEEIVEEVVETGNSRSERRELGLKATQQEGVLEIWCHVAPWPL